MSGKPRFERPAFRLDLNWKITLFTMLFLPVLIGLGFWQLERAEQKRIIQESLARQQALPPIDWQEYQQMAAEQGELRYRRIRLTGRFDDQRSYLIENKTHQGRWGYHLVTPFYLSGGEALLVNRGWLAGTGYRDQLPEFETPRQEVTIDGWLFTPSKNRLLREQPTGGQWPKLRLAVDAEIAQKDMQRPFAPQLLQLGEQNPGAYVIEWQPLNMSPTQHIGYSVQWFGLALALAILWLAANSNIAAIVRNRS